jgi:hypothetical protein
VDARPWPAPAGLAAVSVAAAAVLVGSGVAALDVLAWFAVVGAGVMLPGLVVVRALRGAGPLSEDLAWSLPLGFVLALLTWGAGLVIGMPVSPYWTGVASVALLLVPAVRRRVLGSAAPSEPGWGMGSGSVVVASLVAAAAWAGGSALASLPIDPERPFVWAPDTMFHAALAGEMARTAAPLYPMVPEGPYAYHWFFHALAAHLGQGFGPLVVVTHLLPLTLLLAVVAMAAVAARAVARHRWGAAAGAAAVGLVGMTAPSAWVVLSGITGRSDTDGAGIDPIRLYWQHSASTTLGWLAALAIVAASARVLRDGVAERRGDVALLLAMGALAAGAKSVQTPVLLCGFAAVLLLALVRRRWSLAGRVTLVASLLGGTWLVAVLTMYAGGSAGLEVSPGARAEFMITRMVPALADGVQGGDAVSTPVVGSVLVALWLLPLVPRLLGLLWFVRRPVDPMGLLCGATLAAGVIGTFLTTHPGRSEVFFLVCAYPVGVVGSAAGLVLAADRLRLRWGGRAVVRACAIAATVGAATTAVVASWAGDVSPLVRWRAARPDADVPGDWLSARSQLLAWGAPTLVLVVATALATVVGVLFCGRPTAAGIRRRSAGVLVVLMAGLAGGGLVSTVRDVASGRPELVAARVQGVVDRNPARSRLVVSPTLREAAAIVRRGGSVDDVVVTNRACMQTATVLARSTCDPRDFVVAALTGRRTGVSGWAYAPESLAQALEVKGGYARMPFWDPPRLAEQRALVEQPTPERAAAAWSRGERWVLADRAAGPVSAELSTVGDVLVDRDGIVLVRLRQPGATG